ncbi:MAG: hypothetical protein ACRC9V_01150, partial [Aeromonas sp.]
VISVRIYSTKGVVLQSKTFNDLESQQRWLDELQVKIAPLSGDDFAFFPDGSTIRISNQTIFNAGYKLVEAGVLICIYSTMPHPVGGEQRRTESDPLILALVDSVEAAQDYLNQLAMRLNALA